ncbi:hypothetical protein PC116_g14172 [Phytophthora cactorum]|uniref:Uncharacterized protein n=1 Tax=Phytophthora cactorum TaxID=29920 RepID=A0A8T1KNT9_9STRA|nr:hypothetical protein PC114_g14345 [Phytophthora cactorum]KAG2949658.1 hypothetical protein PC117_g5066 [Phytophthora cactorum]KAG3014777.1 hypothetical protein PC119_g12039 [Phytophthora cactorum]KAG3026168.1 hypothetical protein PC120_g6054 [Phytophthora cactorum]KAG3130022.1 hypothetical protein PC128_g26781 [Phytophthora cactorum]
MPSSSSYHRLSKPLVSLAASPGAYSAPFVTSRRVCDRPESSSIASGVPL